MNQKKKDLHLNNQYSKRKSLLFKRRDRDSNPGQEEPAQAFQAEFQYYHKLIKCIHLTRKL